MNPDIIIATPGRVFHHINEGSLSLKKCKMLVFDEADKLFETGYEEQINYILKSCNPVRQVLLFSATITNQLSNFIKTGIRDYKLIMLDEESRIPEKLKIHMLYCRTEEKRFALLTLLRYVIDPSESTLVFAPTKQHCEMLQEFLHLNGLKSVIIYGQMDQEARTINIDKFRKKKVNILVVTDVAARGLDIPFLVRNFITLRIM
jgi:ATP-dependent RNA helicase DDX54/DBP10